MNRVFVSKDVAYAGKTGGGSITTAKEINDLLEGSLAFLTDKGTVITTLNAATVLPDVKSVMVAIGRSKDTQLLNEVPRTLRDITRGNYRAFTKIVITAGGTTAAKSLTFVDNEECTIRVSDVSYTSRFNVRSVNASLTKRTYNSIEESIDELVTKLNKSEWITAAKVGAGSDFGITITPVEEETAIEVQLSGTFEGGNKEITTPAVYGIGRGKDMLQMEIDASATDEGNGNYIDYTSEWYKRSMQADEASNYDILTLSWEGTHSSPSRSHNVMHNEIAIGCVSGAGNGQAADDVMALLALIFPTVYVPATAGETATDDGTDNDGVAGN